MALSSDERERFLASLRTDAPFREEVRRQVLSVELLELPERFAAFVEEMHAFVEEMHAFVEEMHAFVEEMHAFVEEMHAFREAVDRRFEALESDTKRLIDDSAKLRGMVLEQTIRGNPGYYLHAYARRVKITDVDALLDDLGISLSDEEYRALSRSDILATGRKRDDGERLILVVEASWRSDTGDVDRQAIRQQILLDRGVEAIAIIASTEQPSEQVQAYAKSKGVLLESVSGIQAA